jgi:hypothetical protein
MGSRRSTAERHILARSMPSMPSILQGLKCCRTSSQQQSACSCILSARVNYWQPHLPAIALFQKAASRQATCLSELSSPLQALRLQSSAALGLGSTQAF